jgi:hypothetical protein
MKAETFTFRIQPETRAALEQIAADKEWSVGHVVNSALTEYVARVKPAKAHKVKPKLVTKRQPKPAEEPPPSPADPIPF